MNENLKLWDVLDGATYRLICKVEIDGQIEEAAFWFEDKEDAKNWISHFSPKIDTIEIQ